MIDLDKLLSCDVETGLIFWKERLPEYFSDGKYSKERTCKKWNSRYAKKQAGWMSNGYRYITIGEESFLAHHIVWWFKTGEFPKDLLDHKNGIRDDNRWCNLREASNKENSRNSKISKNNTSGFKGVCKAKGNSGKWRSYIVVDGKQLQLGIYKHKKEAYNAYCEASRKFHKDFGRIV